MSVARPDPQLESLVCPDEVAATLDLSPAQLAMLERFRGMLSDVNASMNLVGDSTMENFWSRHVLDCGQLLTLAPGARVWADLGSGAGLPGVVLAVLLKDTPGAMVHLVESIGKRSRFLADVVTELRLPAKVHSARAETLTVASEIVTARALAPLPRLLTYAEGFLRAGARGLFPKGEHWRTEVAAARASWRFSVEVFPSLSDCRGRILSVTGLARVRSERRR